MASARVEQALERLSEDNMLTGNLTDPEATAVLAWAEQQIVAADAAADDTAFASRVAKIRAAVRAAARVTEDMASITERAERALSGDAPEPGTTTAEATVKPSSQNARLSPVGQSARSATGLLHPPSQASGRERPRRKVRRWTYRKVS